MLIVGVFSDWFVSAFYGLTSSLVLHKISWELLQDPVMVCLVDTELSPITWNLLISSTVKCFSHTQVYLVGLKFAFGIFLIHSRRNVSSRGKLNTL